MASPQKILAETGLTFDDVLLLPGYADFKRSDVNLSIELHANLKLNLPVLSSPMDTVTEVAMAVMMAQHGGLGVIHRNLSPADQAAMVKAVKEDPSQKAAGATLDAKGRFVVGVAVGAGSDLQERIDALKAVEVDVYCVDSAHGYTKFIMDAMKTIKRNDPNAVVIGGNVATAEGAKALADAGADLIRVGMGPGSICTTRVITGMGVPQLTAIMEAAKGVAGTQAKIIADGGIRQMGDIAKALAAGAHCVMLGSMLAGFAESPGEHTEINGQTYKQYRGMGSVSAMKSGTAERYGQSAESAARKLIAEGVEGLVPFKGSGEDFLEQIAGSLRSSFYYIGAKTLTDFQKAQFIKISPAGLRESHPHTLSTIVNAGGNYNDA